MWFHVPETCRPGEPTETDGRPVAARGWAEGGGRRAGQGSQPWLCACAAFLGGVSGDETVPELDSGGGPRHYE